MKSDITKDKKDLEWSIPKLINLTEAIKLSQGECTLGSSDVGGDDCTNGPSPIAGCTEGTLPV